MFEKLKSVFGRASAAPDNGDGLARWAVDRMLSHHRLSNGAVVAEGLLLDRPFQAGCAPSSRPYIVGVELMARADLGLRDDVSIIVMHRALKRALEKAASNLQASAKTQKSGSAEPLPEEMSWLSIYRDAGWPGPTPDFWARYCVLTDSLESAREWLDSDAIESLCDAPTALRPVTPFLIALTRGRVYLRLQMEAPDDGVVSHHALDTLEQLSTRALKLFGR